MERSGTLFKYGFACQLRGRSNNWYYICSSTKADFFIHLAGKAWWFSQLREGLACGQTTKAGSTMTLVSIYWCCLQLPPGGNQLQSASQSASMPTVDDDNALLPSLTVKI